jgi:hypothetical protein
MRVSIAAVRVVIYRKASLPGGDAFKLKVR